MTPTHDVIPPSKIREATGLSKTTVWRLENQGLFPCRIRLSAGRVGYLRAEVEKWLADRPVISREK